MRRWITDVVYIYKMEGCAGGWERGWGGGCFEGRKRGFTRWREGK